MSRQLKGLTKQLIKAAKDKELHFSKDELNAIKESANVRLYKKPDGFYLDVRAEYGNGYFWTGSYRHFDNKDGEMNIYSGFAHNPIGRVDENYTCERPYGTNYKEEFNTLTRYMKNARKKSLAGDQAYRDFVRTTGCLD